MKTIIDFTDFVLIRPGKSIADFFHSKGLGDVLSEETFLDHLMNCNGLSRAEIFDPLSNFRRIGFIHPLVLFKSDRYHSYLFRSLSFLGKMTETSDKNLGYCLRSLAEKESFVVADLGAGLGRMSLELLNSYPHSKVIAWARSEDDGVSGPHDLYRTAKDLKLAISEADLDRVSFVFKDFSEGDLEELGIEEIDFVISTATIRYVKEKIRLIEEVYRSLKVGGMALLHIQQLHIHGSNFSDFLASKEKFRNFKISESGVLFILKDSPEPLFFGLALDLEESFERAWNPQESASQAVGWTSWYQA